MRNRRLIKGLFLTFIVVLIVLIGWWFFKENNPAKVLPCKVDLC